jgi:hypothetical protein
MSAVLIKNRRIVTAVDDYQADLLIEDGAKCWFIYSQTV